MKFVKFAILCVLFSSLNLSCQTQAKPLYEISEDKKTNENVKIDETQKKKIEAILVGNDSGLYRVYGKGIVTPLWTKGKVRQILKTESFDANSNKIENWYLITSKGILFSSDLENFEFRNNGIPFLVLNEFDGTNNNFIEQCEDIKDISYNPLRPEIMVTATKNNVYISYDAGINWKSLGSMSTATAGIKAVAVADMPFYDSDGNENGTELAVFMSHPIFGLSYILPEKDKVWHDVTAGFVKLPSISYPDEISDILPAITTDESGKTRIELFLSQTFIPNIYKFDWAAKKGILIYSESEPSRTIESLNYIDNNLVFVKTKSICSVNINSDEANSETTAQANSASDFTAEKSTLVKNASDAKSIELFSEWEERFDAFQEKTNTAWIPKSLSGFEKDLIMNELWLLTPEKTGSSYAKKILGKKSLYIPPYQVRKQLGDEGIDKFISIAEENNLNSIVIDMKDDYGFLRYKSNNPLILEKGTESSYSVDLDNFIAKFKAKNIYLVARIVTFKDRNLTRYAGGKYAVWDKSLNKPWLGIKGYEDIKDEETGEVTGKTTLYYDENWVDPYSQEVWEYNVEIAKELVGRGFDEIQFDYIRFPTDGYNLRNAVFRWHSNRMSKESALMSFLSYARKNIKAPIGIDIYGANGWYRSGTRTGQDVEMLSNYVDVICPMFYPSHFELNFLDYEPYGERPYRIYFYGSYRNTVLGRNSIIVRPWVQAFKLPNRYDNKFYGKNYVQQEIFGVRDSVNTGYMYWNNVGNYETLQKDIGDSQYTGTTRESSLDFEKPVFDVSKGR